MNRYGIGLALLGLTSLSACTVSTDAGDEDVTGSSTEALGPGQHAYLRCNATGWNPNDDTRLVQTSFGVYEITFDVTESWMIDSNDHCMLTVTNQLNGWGTQQQGLHTNNVILNPPETAPVVSGFQSVVLDYAALGSYKVTFNDNSDTLSIAPAQTGVAGNWHWPIDGVNGVDWVINNYVDIGFGSQLDYTGGPRTYPGHAGVDIDLGTFRNQDAGVPVRAVKAGQVMETHETEPDRNTGCAGPWNFVRVRTADNTDIWYGHLRTNSVVVNPNDMVTEGQILGQVGSSGCSTQPHLHLEAFDRFGVLVDPFRDNLWTNPPAYNVPLGIMDIIVTNDPEMSWLDPAPNITTLSAPWQLITAASLGGGFNNASFQIRIRRPNGTLFDQFEATYPHPTGHTFFGWSWDLSQDFVAGTWKAEYLVNGVIKRTHNIQVIP